MHHETKQASFPCRFEHNFMDVVRPFQVLPQQNTEVLVDCDMRDDLISN